MFDVQNSLLRRGALGMRPGLVRVCLDGGFDGGGLYCGCRLVSFGGAFMRGMCGGRGGGRCCCLGGVLLYPGDMSRGSYCWRLSFNHKHTGHDLLLSISGHGVLTLLSHCWHDIRRIGFSNCTGRPSVYFMRWIIIHTGHGSSLMPIVLLH